MEDLLDSTDPDLLMNDSDKGLVVRSDLILRYDSVKFFHVFLVNCMLSMARRHGLCFNQSLELILID